MENAIPIGLSRQIVLARALDVTANNIANQNTAGYRAERITFQEYLIEAQGVGAGHKNDLSLVVDPRSVTDFSQGELVQTYATLDFAIAGDGFFAVDTGDDIGYTRNGHFGISPFGELVTRNGHNVLDDSGAPILLNPQGSDLVLSPEGELQQDGITVARLGVYGFEDNRLLTREGNNLFRAPIEGTPLTQPAIQQGFVEAANVQAIEGITNLIKISRAYTQAAELIETANELSREAIRSFTDTT